MKICAISDIHEQFRKITDKIKDCDVLVCAGDITYRGDIRVIKDYNLWIKELKDAGRIKHCVTIPGNHDLTFQFTIKDYNKWSQSEEKKHQEAINSATEYHLLIDKGVTIEGKTFYGTPWTPVHGGGWAFQLYGDEDKNKYYGMIPNNLDVLVSHGPPLGYNDFVQDGKFGEETIWRNAGCKVLLDHLYKKSPKFHVCGHLHDPVNQFPNKLINGTTIINASICDEEYKTSKDPIYFEVP